MWEAQDHLWGDSRDGQAGPPVYNPARKLAAVYPACPGTTPELPELKDARFAED